MTLKVHMMGPRSATFPFKPEGSWFVKLDNRTHCMLKDRVIREHISLEDALLKTIMEGIELMKQDMQETSKDLED
ncbi:MAG: hypothetical protein JHC33_14560 [Ignisphaera sp.]|nr:hypothetical protein [Ignisphaera sp.]